MKEPQEHLRRRLDLDTLWDRLKRVIGAIRSDAKELATKLDLTEVERRIMSKISEFYEKQTQFNQRLENAVSGLGEDITAMTELIKQLQNNPGPITPEDQALLDELQTKGDALATKLEALNDLTPPVQPPPV